MESGLCEQRGSDRSVGACRRGFRRSIGGRGDLGSRRGVRGWRRGVDKGATGEKAEGAEAEEADECGFHVGFDMVGVGIDFPNQIKMLLNAGNGYGV